MSAPNRREFIANLFSSGAITALPETDADDGRRSNLYRIIAALNVADGGQWGCLVKTDQGGKVPADIIVWRSTMEHFDILAGGGGGPVWKESGIVPNDTWIWKAVGGVDVPNGPETPNTPETPNNGTVVPAADFVAAVLSFIEDARAKLGVMHQDILATKSAVEAAPIGPGAPDVKFPHYEGTVSVPFLGSGKIALDPKV